MKRIPVAVLGSTGSVGQRFVQLLQDHPWFDLRYVTGSERRLGQTYAETCRWVLSEPMPEKVRSMDALPSEPGSVPVPLVFSALPSGVAKEVEPKFAEAGTAVFTNAGAFRREKDVPILLPEVNADHIDLVPEQRRNRAWKGFIVTNPNCTSTGTTIVLKALQEAFGLSRVVAVSLQAISGAGYPGVPSLDILDNVIPHISGEEEKFAWEPMKMLGRFRGQSIEPAHFKMSTHCNRVNVSDGHLVCLTLELQKEVSPAEAVQALAGYQAPEVCRNLPSNPRPAISVMPESDRPQPRLDRMSGKGMTTVVGRVREDSVFHIRLIVLSHNTVRGAAGGSIYNAELAVRKGLVT